MSTKRKISSIQSLLDERKIQDTLTKGQWCLKEGLEHLSNADNSFSRDLLQTHGVPSFYKCTKPGDPYVTSPSTCFQSLCRIVAGQFVSGHAAKRVWEKFQVATNEDITPKSVLRLSQGGADIEEGLQQRIGVTKRKACTIVELAQRFESNELSEEFLEQGSEEQVRKALMSVKGLGPWSCDIFLLFYLERPNILPIGDLGVRKGIQAHFGIKGSAAKGQLCPKKDAEVMTKRLEPYRPYLSLITFYMWRVADTPEVLPDSDTPSTPRSKKVARTVTP